ncbi:Rhodanese- sulfurtransferase [Tilletia horrida]|nr:Rhodanese- sulfurtransferase [Tilletia horrida]KAK0569636.1 Rhodanese- sulfurtransferase [Tilletia horrida]
MAPTTLVAPNAVGGTSSTANGAGPSSDRLPLELDAGLLSSVDPNAVDEDVFPADPSTSTAALDEHLLSRAQQATQSLFNAVFSLPVTRHIDHGPIVTLPPPLLILPREKPLPAPKPMTKWEKFAKAKGISKRKKDKMIFDDDTQEWVPRWGFKGANKKEEEQWLHPVKANADDDYSPARAAKRARKDRKLKNEGQRQRNLQRAAAANAASGSSSARSSGFSKENGNGTKKSPARR